MGKEPEETWTEEELLKFSSIYTRFSAEYKEKGGDKLNISTGDAFLSFITLYGYEAVNEKTTSELQALIAKSW